MIYYLFQTEEATKSSQTAHYSWPLGAPRQRLNALHQIISGINVHTAILVGQRRLGSVLAIFME